MSADGDKALWPYELDDLRALQKALEAAYENREAKMLYLKFDRVEACCDDQRVGYFDLLDDSVVFTLDRAALEE